MSLVNNVLDLSRLEADMMKYQLTDYDIVQLCNDAICSAQMQRSNLHIHFQKSVNEYIIHTDCNRMMQIITSTLTGFSTVQEEREVHFQSGQKWRNPMFQNNQLSFGRQEIQQSGNLYTP